MSRRRSRRHLDPGLADADVEVEVQLSVVAGQDGVDLQVHAVVDPVEPGSFDDDLSDPAVGVDVDRGVRRDDHHDLADREPDRQVDGLALEVEVGQVDDELPEPVAVGRLEVVEVVHDHSFVADTRPPFDVDDGREPQEGQDQEAEDDEAHGPADERGQDEAQADDQQGGGEVRRRLDVDDIEPVEQNGDTGHDEEGGHGQAGDREGAALVGRLGLEPVGRARLTGHGRGWAVVVGRWGRQVAVLGELVRGSGDQVRRGRRRSGRFGRLVVGGSGGWLAGRLLVGAHPDARPASVLGPQQEGDAARDQQEREEEALAAEAQIGQPQERPAEDEDRREYQQDRDDAPTAGPVASLQGSTGGAVGLALLGDDQPGDQVEKDSRPAEDGEDHESDPYDDRVDVEVAADSGGDSGDDPVVSATTQLPRRARRIRRG